MNKTCKVCGMIFDNSLRYDPQHHSYHYHYLHSLKRFDSMVVLKISHWKEIELRGFGKIRTLNLVLMKEGAHDVLLVSFNRHLYNTRKYMPFSEFIKEFDITEYDDITQRAIKLYKAEIS